MRVNIDITGEAVTVRHYDGDRPLREARDPALADDGAFQLFIRPLLDPFTPGERITCVVCLRRNGGAKDNALHG